LPFRGFNLTRFSQPLLALLFPPNTSSIPFFLPFFSYFLPLLAFFLSGAGALEDHDDVTKYNTDAEKSLLPHTLTLIFFLCSFPFLSFPFVSGAGALEDRDDVTKYNTEAEKSLFVPQTYYYHEMATKAGRFFDFRATALVRFICVLFCVAF
jgi:hypothetical protein